MNSAVSLGSFPRRREPITRDLTDTEYGSPPARGRRKPRADHPETVSCELPNQRSTSKSMILVPLLNPKFAIGLPGTALANFRFGALAADDKMGNQASRAWRREP